MTGTFAFQATQPCRHVDYDQPRLCSGGGLSALSEVTFEKASCHRLFLDMPVEDCYAPVPWNRDRVDVRDGWPFEKVILRTQTRRNAPLFVHIGAMSVLS